MKLDLTSNTHTLEKWFRRSAEGGAQIAVAPEGALDGYVVNEIIAHDYDTSRMSDVALEIDSTTIQHFQDLARELDMCLVFGFAEKVARDVFNCAVFIDYRGEICGKYHKMQFHEGYDNSWWFNRLGKTSRAFDTPYGRCGVMICNDRWNPLLAKIPALDGAQFLVIPAFGSNSKSQDDAVLARSVENNLPVIEANVGVSLIVSDGKIVATDRRQEGVTFADISIPAKRERNEAARGTAEAEFLAWRDVEMPKRLANRHREIGKVFPTATTKIGDHEISWHDARDIGVEGRAFNDTESFYDRLPARAKGVVRDPVWSLAQHAAGMCVRFSADAQSMTVRWKLRSDSLAMPHMPAT
ncbi:MAG: hypothetical protein KDB27_31860, partial [Planctomycetales bacterium]|nr:hypothetical protein [Planctomycetales bacterium]